MSAKMQYMPYMQFYVNDFDQDTCGLTSVAVGVWLRILIAMHRQRKSELRGSLDRIAKITRCEVCELEVALVELENDDICNIERDCNNTVTITCRRLKREEEERAQTAERVRKYRERQAKAKEETQANHECNGDVTLFTRAYNQNQIQNQIQNIECLNNISTENQQHGLFETCLTFDEFWNMYGKKVERVKCEKIYAKIKEADREKIKEHVSVYVASTPDPQYRKNPQTYLNGHCWEDEIITTNEREQNNGNSRRASEYGRYVPKHL